ncbi:MAG: hypothetical protein IJU84_02885 [Clostridia bacterium]|nr:hypothetical protein [Clostridia bacterium]
MKKTSKKRITFTIEPNVHEKFTVALMLSGETQKAALEKCVKEYISKTFYKESEKFSTTTPLSTETPKAIKRIPRWAKNPDQINHKIIRAYLLLSAENEQVTSYDMERRCLDRNFSDTYAPTFRNNFAQMKIETPKSTGKVFEEKNGFVTVWERVAPTLESYREYFTEEREPSETSEQ